MVEIVIPNALSFSASGIEPMFLFWSWFWVLQYTQLLAGAGQDVRVIGRGRAECEGALCPWR